MCPMDMYYVSGQSKGQNTGLEGSNRIVGSGLNPNQTKPKRKKKKEQELAKSSALPLPPT